MINVLAIGNYRSIKHLVIPLKRLNLITGANGSGKSNLYRALRLLAETGQDGVIAPLAREGGLKSAFWAGPETITQGMRRGDQPIQGSQRTEPVRLKLGFSGDDFGYAATLGLPPPEPSAFRLDPEFKREAIWAGPFLRSANLLVERTGAVVRRRRARDWDVLTQHLPAYESLFSQVGKDRDSPEVFEVRETLRNWRFTTTFAPTRWHRRASRNWAHAPRSCTTTAAISPPRFKPYGRSATRPN